MIAYRLDTAIMRFAKVNRLRYTRYADDLSMSGYQMPLALFKTEVPPPGKIPLDRLSDEFLSLISANGFVINSDKVWFSGPRSRREVTGLVVNEFSNLKRKFIRNVRASLHKIQALGIAAAQADHQARYSHNRDLQNIVRGQLEWIAQVRGRSFDPYRTYAKQYNALFPGSKPLVILPKLEEVGERAVWIIDVTVGDDCFQGTAVFVQGIGLVTAEHVLIGLATGDAAELYHPSQPAAKFAVSPSSKRCVDRDLAILDHTIPEDRFLSLPVASYPARNQDNVSALGYADYGPGDEMSKRGGKLNAHATKHGVKMIEVSAILTDGMSGGPILNDKYEVIGLIHKGGNQEHKQLAIDVGELINLASEPHP